MIRTKGEAGTGNVVSAVQHAVLVSKEIEYACEISEGVRMAKSTRNSSHR